MKNILSNFSPRILKLDYEVKINFNYKTEKYIHKQK